jgi:hypothetical protein
MSAEIIRVSDRAVRLCCNKKGCPVVEDLGDGRVRITDDDGNKIVVKKEEASLISDGVRTLNETQTLLLG